MNIEIKISKKPINYKNAIKTLENRVSDVISEKKPELIWILKHPSVYTAGVRYNKNDIIDKNIKIIKTNRGGKITYHGPGQLIFYVVINLNNRKKDIRWFIDVLEKTIKRTLKFYNIKSFSNKKNVGIWVKHNNKRKKIAAVGVKIKKWVAYHGFSLNLKVDLNKYSKIAPCGLDNKNIVNLNNIYKGKLNNINFKLIKNFKINLYT